MSSVKSSASKLSAKTARFPDVKGSKRSKTTPKTAFKTTPSHKVIKPNHKEGK